MLLWRSLTGIEMWRFNTAGAWGKEAGIMPVGNSFAWSSRSITFKLLPGPFAVRGEAGWFFYLDRD